MDMGSARNAKRCKRVADFDLNVEAAPAVHEDHESQENRSEKASMCRIKDDRRTCVTLQCGHKFHLDCIAKEFSEKKEMKCPNCGYVEQSRWFNPNLGSKSESESDGLCPFERDSGPNSPVDSNSVANAMTHEDDSDSDSGEDSFDVLV